MPVVAKSPSVHDNHNHDDHNHDDYDDDHEGNCRNNDDANDCYIVPVCAFLGVTPTSRGWRTRRPGKHDFQWKKCCSTSKVNLLHRALIPSYNCKGLCISLQVFTQSGLTERATHYVKLVN